MANLSHGHTVNRKTSPTFVSWWGMIQRCNNPKNHAFKWYGAKGRKVCKRWMRFENFLKDMGIRPTGMTLDRHPNTSMLYSKKTCRWATRAEQSRNRGHQFRENRTSKYKGVSFSKVCKSRPWRAAIRHNGKQIHIGFFSTEELASKAYLSRSKLLYGN